MHLIKFFLVLTCFWATSLSAAEPATSPLTMVVMDPLAKELSCPCVKGYAQRDYNQLAQYLTEKLGRPVQVAFSDSLVAATKNKTNGQADIVIGKRSVVLADAKTLDRTLYDAAKLSGKDGVTTQTGLIVVPAKDLARTVADLKDYLIVFGPAECAEKHAAALALLKKHDVAVPAKLETAGGCDEGATRILELPVGQRGAAVISSYAKPLLEGCGTVPKGSLRVVGETEPVPFVEAFVAATVPADLAAKLIAALDDVGNQPQLCQALETQRGFIIAKKPIAPPNAQPTADPGLKKN